MAWVDRLCISPGCKWPRGTNPKTGYVYQHCCSGCNRTEGTNHSSYCPARSWEGSGAARPSCGASSSAVGHTRDDDRSRSPRRSRSRCPKQGKKRTILTLGREGHLGKQLLKKNPWLQDHRRCYDVTNMLRDPDRDREKDNPPGTELVTQKRIRNLDRFPEVHASIIRGILSETVFVVMCTHGKHRSVASAELAVKDVSNLTEIELDIEVIHLELASRPFINAIWSRLCAM